MAYHNDIGVIGENLTASFLMKQGFTILERNYRVSQGEIDIIATKQGIFHYVEVKSVSVADCHNLENLRITPEDNLTHAKWQKLRKAIEVYKSNKNVPHETGEQVDLACVYIDTEKKEGRVKLIQNIYKEN